MPLPSQKSGDLSVAENSEEWIHGTSPRMTAGEADLFLAGVKTALLNKRHGFYAVAVGVADEGCVVIGSVLWTQAGFTVV